MLNKDDFEFFFKEPTKDKLNKLLKTHTGESNNLEFKEKWIETDKLAKIVISIINSGGGVIIFGIKEKKDDKIFLNTGLSKADIQDKTDMMKKLNSYIQNVFYEIRDFDYTDASYGELQGKYFQILLIYSDKSKLPIFSKKESDNIKLNEIYIRRGAATVIANNEELNTIIENTVKARINNFISGDINEELMQLKVLYSFQKQDDEYDYLRTHFGYMQEISNIVTGIQKISPLSKRQPDKFQEELNDLVIKKLQRIKKLLHLEY